MGWPPIKAPSLSKLKGTWLRKAATASIIPKRWSPYEDSLTAQSLAVPDPADDFNLIPLDLLTPAPAIAALTIGQQLANRRLATCHEAYQYNSHRVHSF